jgi:hypothetical protein
MRLTMFARFGPVIRPMIIGHFPILPCSLAVKKISAIIFEVSLL